MAENKKEASVKDFLSTRKEGKKIDLTKRKKVEFMSDFGAYKKGDVFEIFIEEADYYIDKGICKEKVKK